MTATPQIQVKNEYIDCVTIPPFIDVHDWIHQTKEKLQLRENKLLSIKISKIENIVNKTLSELSIKYIYKINDMIKHIINTSIIVAIHKWPGVDKDRMTKKRNLIKFQDYFGIGKNWWDLRKQKVIATSFWITIIDDLHQVHKNFMYPVAAYTIHSFSCEL